MKMMPVKKSILKRVALSVLVVSMHSALPSVENNNHEAHITSLNIAGSFIHNIDKHFVDLVNSNIKAPLNTFLTSIGKTIQDLKQKGEAIKRSNDPITMRLHELFEYVIRKFNIAYDILKKYNGKPANCATELSIALKREFNTEEIFTEILKRLRVIKALAQQENDAALVEKIDLIIGMVDKKRKEWHGRSEFSLFTGLSYRMQCK